jgi:predicted AAA+ superfamily ATPase
VKAPKVYITDTGVLHTLLGLDSAEDLLGHPQVGSSWEWLSLSNVVERLGADWGREAYFWGTYAGAEIDLVIIRGNLRLGFEVKRTSAPSLTPSMRIAMEDLGLERIDVLHAGRETFPLAEGIRALPTHRIWTDIEEMG